MRKAHQEARFSTKHSMTGHMVLINSTNSYPAPTCAISCAHSAATKATEARFNQGSSRPGSKSIEHDPAGTSDTGKVISLLFPVVLSQWPCSSCCDATLCLKTRGAGTLAPRRKATRPRSYTMTRAKPFRPGSRM